MAELRVFTLDEVFWLIREVSQDMSPVGCFELTLPGSTVSVTAPTGGISWVTNGASATVTPTRPTLAGLLYALQITPNGPKPAVMLDYDPKALQADLLPMSGVSMEADKPAQVMRAFYYSDKQIDLQMLAFLQAKLGDRFGYNTSSSTGYYVTQVMGYEHIQQMVLWVAYWLLDSRRQAMSGANFMRNQALGLGDERLVNRVQDITTKVGDTFTVRETEEADGSGAANMTNLWGDKYSYLAKLQLYIRNRLEKLYGDFTLRDNIIVASSFTIERNWRPNDYVDGIRLSGTTTDLLLGS